MPLQIHESLRLTNLSKLPLSIRASAKSAANGSYDDLHALTCALPDLPKLHRRLILPVLYIHLNADKIPTSLQLDSILSDADRHGEFRPITAAIECLTGISESLSQDSIPRAAYADLWPRLFPWISFVHTCHLIIPATFRVLPVEHMLFICANIILAIDKYAPMSSTVRSSPDLRAVLTSYWASLLRRDGELTQELDASAGIPGSTLRDERCTPVLAILADDPIGHLAELTNGAGGSDTLAYLMVTQLKDFLARDLSELTSLTLTTIIAIMGSISVRKEEDDAFNRELHSHGIAKVLARTLCALDVWFCRGGDRDRAHDAAVEVSLTLLGEFFRWRVGHEAIAGALDGGLLTFIVSSRTLTPKSYPIIKVFEALIPGALLYFPVVCQMKTSYTAALPHTTTPTFAKSKVYPMWQKFAPVVKLRLEALEFFHSEQWVSSKVCENMKCFKLAEKSVLKNCSGCDFSYYCSSECQKIDWKAGHRQWCAKLAPLIDFPGLVSPRSRAYLRAMLEYNLGQFRPLIMLRQAAFIYTNPDTPFFTAFDFQRLGTGEDFIKIEAMSAYERAPEAAIRLEQLARSEGRLQLHAVIINGNPPLLKMFPMWSTSARMMDGIHRIVKSFPPALPWTEMCPPLVDQLRELHMQCVAHRVRDIYS
ncbi:hypothetical protein C8F04DRAFT_477759 [Mycena alexandri]|uniref:MYND-type domain-containing protein n=1 Tax=Mycena alexandri TaxID=1745969 RepID=A0AAD6X8T8_9AGAR|nr:hypothetical protein C8F04DRAFT_477759 [Mycena alexandri]